METLFPSIAVLIVGCYFIFTQSRLAQRREEFLSNQQSVKDTQAELTKLIAQTQAESNSLKAQIDDLKQDVMALKLKASLRG